MLKTKTTLLNFLNDLSGNTKKHSLNLLLAALLSSVFVIIAYAVFYGLYYLIISKTSFNTILAVRFTFLMFRYLVILILASIVQIATLKVFFDPQVTISNLFTGVKTHFWRFLGLSIIINILFFLFSLPIYVAIFLFAIQNYIFSLIALLIGILLMLLFAGYIIFSPFIMIEKQKKIYNSIRESMNMASDNIWGILAKIVILIAAMVALNYIFSLFITIPFVGQIIELAAIFVFYIIFIIYIYTIYQNLKSNA